MDSSESTTIALPDELIIEILSWLPAKSLLRFKSVSKAFLSLVQNPDFISKHLHNSKIHPRNRGLILLPNPNSNTSSSNSLTFLSGETLDVSFKIPIPRFFGNPQIFVISGPCNGIFCVKVDTGLILWNPAINEFKVLPKHHIPYQFPNLHFESCIGFGFDSETNDYKVVNVLFSHAAYICLLEIYSWKSNSWKTKALQISSLVHPDSPSRSSNGVIYWTGCIPVETGHIAVSLYAFKMRNNRFFELPLPEILRFSSKTLALSLLNESIALVAFEYDGHCTPQFFDVWVMEENYGMGSDNRYSWTKFLRFGPVIPLAYPLGFWGNGEVILLNSDDGVIVFNENGKAIRSLRVRGQVHFYEESLISIR